MRLQVGRIAEITFDPIPRHDTMNTPRIRNTSHQSMSALYRSRERMVHVSAPIVMHPLFERHLDAGNLRDYQYRGPRFMVGAGTTFNIGRNEAKRHRNDVIESIGRRKVRELRRHA